MTHLMLTIAVLCPAGLAWKLLHAFVKPFKPHGWCGGKGLDPYCHYRGKVPRFGARWVRRQVVTEWRNS